MEVLDCLTAPETEGPQIPSSCRAECRLQKKPLGLSMDLPHNSAHCCSKLYLDALKEKGMRGVVEEP